MAREKVRFYLYQCDIETPYKFRDFDKIEKLGGKFSIDDYKCVYDGVICCDMEDIVLLNKLFEKFNLNHPADFKGHSMSVSDVVTIIRENGKTTYYTDGIGFKKVESLNRRFLWLDTNDQNNWEEDVEFWFKVPIEWAEKWFVENYRGQDTNGNIVKEKYEELDDFMDDYIWDDSWKMYCQAVQDGVMLEREDK